MFEIMLLLMATIIIMVVITMMIQTMNTNVVRSTVTKGSLEKQETVSDNDNSECLNRHSCHGDNNNKMKALENSYFNLKTKNINKTK